MPTLSIPTLSPATMHYRNRHQSVHVVIDGVRFEFQVTMPSVAAISRFLDDNYRGVLIPVQITIPAGITIPSAVNGVVTTFVKHDGQGIRPFYQEHPDEIYPTSFAVFVADIVRLARHSRDTYDGVSLATMRFLSQNLTEEVPVANIEEVGTSLHNLLDISTVGLGWSEDMPAFQRVYTQAREALVDQKAVFDPIEGDPMRGFASLYLDGFDGRTFGLEIEVDFPDSYPYNTQKEALAQRLYDEGLSDSPRVHGWHWRGREQDNRSRTLGGGYTSTHDGWSVEFDRTVDDVDGQRGCEIVSPIMSNTSQWWEDITKVLAIVQELGGAVSTRHGLHVNLGARDFTDLATRNLYTLARSFDATLIRLAHNPNVGRRHRGRTYCNPLTFINPNQGTGYVAREAIYCAGHRNIINMSSFSGIAENKRVEFRMFDPSLDVLRIQRYVMLAMAMMHTSVSLEEAVEHDTSFNDFSSTHGVSNRRRSGEAWEAATLPVRRLVDALRLSPEAAVDVVRLFTESRYISA